MAARPKVTVFIPAYNRERYLCVAVNSILAQTFTDFELLLVDDGSTDGTLELMQRYAAVDRRVRVVANEANLGIPRTRNRGLDLARGEYLALLDSDDYAYPGRLAAQVHFLDRHPDYVQVGSWGSFMDSTGKLRRRLRRQPVDPEETRAELLFRCALSNRSILARTKALQAYRYREDFPSCEDYELHVRLAERYRMTNLPAVLVCGRKHAQRYTALTPDLGHDRKRAIERSQLEALGLRPSVEDFENHHRLVRCNAASVDRDYLEWAEDWLAALLNANRLTGRYGQATLARATARRWLDLCLLAQRSHGARTAARMLRSPLLRTGWPCVSWRGLWPPRPPLPNLDASAPAAS